MHTHDGNLGKRGSGGGKFGGNRAEIRGRGSQRRGDQRTGWGGAAGWAEGQEKGCRRKECEKSQAVSKRRTRVAGREDGLQADLKPPSRRQGAIGSARGGRGGRGCSWGGRVAPARKHTMGGSGKLGGPGRGALSRGSANKSPGAVEGGEGSDAGTLALTFVCYNCINKCHDWRGGRKPENQSLLTNPTKLHPFEQNKFRGCCGAR